MFIEKLKHRIRRLFHWIMATWLRRFVATVLAILMIIGPVSFLLFKKEAKASWWDDKWSYRKSIDVTNNTTAESNVYVSVTLDTTDTTKFQTNCGDLRFTKYNGSLLPYYIESGCGTASTVVYVGLDSFPAGQQTIFYYYGNPNAPDGFSTAQTGNVTQANMKMSIVNGTAFADFSAANTLANNLNSKVIIKDSTNKMLTGFIKAAGTGETYGSELLSNTTFDTNLDNWTALNGASQEMVAGGVSGNAIKVILPAVLSANSVQTFSITSGAIYSANVYAKQGTDQWQTIALYEWRDDYSVYGDDGRNSPDWSLFSAHAVAATTDTVLAISLAPYYSPATAGKYALFDNASVKQITAPSATGATVTSTSNGTTYNWTTEEGSFNRNDSSGYTYTIYPLAFSVVASNYTVGSLGTEEISPAPVGYWSFDEGQGATAHDESEKGNDGTITGATWKPESECVIGKCLYFNGTSDYVNAGTGVSLQNAPANMWTISSWVKPTGDNFSTGSRNIIRKNGAGDGYFLRSNNGAIQSLFHYTDGYVERSSGTFDLNVWQQVVVSYDGTTTRLYKNGKLLNSWTENKTLSFDTSAVYIGSVGGYNEYWSGLIDELKIYPYARTANQIKQDYNAGLAGAEKISKGTTASFGDQSDKWMTDGLVGHWKMDETSGTTVTDASGNNNTGTLTSAQETGTSDASGNSVTTLVDTDGTLSTTDDAYNGMILRNTSACGGIASGTERLISDYTGTSKTFLVSPAWANAPDSCPYEVRHQVGGKFGNGINFDGSNDYVSVADNDAHDPRSHSFSVSVWANFGTFRNYDSFASKFTGDITDNPNMGDGWTIWHYGSSLYFVVTDGPNNYRRGQFSLGSLQGWHHVTGVWDSASQVATIYVDGIGSAAHSSGGTIADIDNSVNLTLGGLGASYQKYKGIIDETRIYNRALSPGEISDLYNFAPGPVGHWKMDDTVSGNGQTIVDASGYGNNGTTDDGANDTGMDCTAQGKYGGACEFDGADDKINLGQQNILKNLNSPMTVSAWVKYDSLPAGCNTIIGKLYDWQVGIASNQKLRFKRWNVYQAFDSNTSLLSGQWYHVAFTLTDNSSNNFIFYLNGKIDGTGTITNPLLNEGVYDTLISGYIQSDIDYFDGSIDDVRVYDYVRTSKQVVEDMNAGHPAGGSPIASQLTYLKMDEGYGTIAYDSGFNNDDGDLVDGPSWINDGRFGKALSFDGLNDRVQGFVSDPLEYWGTSGFTISVWVNKSSSDAGNSYIISKPWNGNGNYNYRIQTGATDKVSLYLEGATTFNLDSNSSISDNAWHHILVSVNNVDSKVKIFIDGKLDKEGTHSISSWTPPNGDNNVSLCLGSLYPYGSGWAGDTGHAFQGKLDEVKIYNSALSEEEIKIDYNKGAVAVMGNDTSRNNNGTAVTGKAKEYCIPGDTATCTAPVGEWKMDELASTTIYDTSGNGNNGTVNGATWTQGKKGRAFSFDGTDDYTSNTNDSDLQISTGTAEAWIKTSNAGTSYRGIVVKQLAYGMFLQDNVFGIYDWNTNTWRSSGVSLNDGNWHHVVFSFQSGVSNGTILYVDGQAKATTTMAINAQTVALALGSGTDGVSQNFNGLIDDVKIYSYVRTPAQIAWDYNKGAPIAEYRFNECQGATVHDESGNGNNGTITLGASGNTTPGTCQTPTDGTGAWYDGRNGKYGASLDFDGTDDYVGFNQSISGSNTYTISCWTKTNILNSAFRGCAAIGSAGTRQAAYIGLQNNNTIGGGYYSGNLSTGITPVLYQWYHIVQTYSADGYTRIYVDGELKTENNSNTPSITGSTGFIGKIVDGYFWNGQIDDVKVFSYPLTATQVKDLYNGGAASFR